MEEKLRNLSRNIANNTGPREADEPKEQDEDRISDDELRDMSSDEGEEQTQIDNSLDAEEDTSVDSEEQDAPESHDEESEHSDIDSPEEHEETEEPKELEHQEETDERNEDEPSEDNNVHDETDVAPADEEAVPITIHSDSDDEREEIDEHNDDIEPHEEEPKEDEAPEADEPVDDSPEPEQTAEENVETQPEETQPAKAAILTMEEEAQEPLESPNRTKKYSPEVEAALNRLNSDEITADLSEPLSTEPRKKKHHGGQIFLFILFVLAIAVGSICILVEQKIIDNPFPNLLNKTDDTSEVQPEPSTPSKPVQKYLEIAEWGIKILKPEGVNGFWYDTVSDEENKLRIFGTDSSYVADETSENQGANAVIDLIRSTDSSLQYSDDLTISPTTSLSGYYYYLVLTHGDPDDNIVAIFEDQLLINTHAILAL